MLDCSSRNDHSESDDSAEQERIHQSRERTFSDESREELGLNLDADVEQTIFRDHKPGHRSSQRIDGDASPSKRSDSHTEMRSHIAGTSASGSRRRLAAEDPPPDAGIDATPPKATFTGTNWDTFSQLRELQEQNRHLLVALNRRTSEVKILRQELTESISPAAVEAVITEAHKIGAAPGDHLRETKIIELAKKARRINVALERERSINATLSARVKHLEDEKRNVSPRPPGNTKALPADKGEVRTLRDKISQLMRRLQEERTTSQALRSDMRTLQKIVASEIGEDVPIDRLIGEGGAGWKGRAGQISLLQSKVRDLTVKLANLPNAGPSAGTAPGSAAAGAANRRSGIAPSISGDGGASDADPYDANHRETIRKLNAQRQAELEKLREESDVLNSERASMKIKMDAMHARTKLIEREYKNLKSKVSVLLAKTENDDHLIQALRAELSKNKSSSLSPKAPPADLAHLRTRCAEQASRIEHQQKEIERLREQQLQLGAYQPAHSTAAPAAETAHDAGGLLKDSPGADAEVAIASLKALLRASEVEVGKLRELRAAYDKNLIEVAKEREQLRKELAYERHRVEKLQATAGKSHPRKLKPDVEGSEADNLRTKLAIQKDENEALRMTLTTTVERKESELREMYELLDQTRSSILSGILKPKRVHAGEATSPAPAAVRGATDKSQRKPRATENIAQGETERDDVRAKNEPALERQTVVPVLPATLPRLLPSEGW